MPHSHSTDRTGISRRGFVALSIAGAGVTAAAMATPEAAHADEPALAPVVADYPNQIKIAHLSDTHFFSRRLYSDARTSQSPSIPIARCSVSPATSSKRPWMRS
ncbi:MAG: hypothetical protein ACLUW6_11660 [Coriobacteriaceae bacterium]